MAVSCVKAMSRVTSTVTSWRAERAGRASWWRIQGDGCLLPARLPLRLVLRMPSRLVLLLLPLMLTGAGLAGGGEPSLRRLKTPDGIEYGIWGEQAAGPAPVLFVLAGTIEGTLGKPYFRQCGEQLAKRGYQCVSIDLPGHGTQIEEGVPAGLSGWSRRVARGEDMVAECNVRLGKVLDHLLDTDVADEARIAVCGTSRGGFLAIHFAAHDVRVRCVAAFAPVTDLAALSEFRGMQDHPLVGRLSLAAQARRLAGRPLWVVIGDQDERVSTRAAFEFTQAVTAASRAAQRPSRVELHVMPESRGHTTPQGSAERAAGWIAAELVGAADGQTAEGGVRLDAPPAVGEPAVTDSRRHLLLVDDHHVLYRSGTERVFHPATIHPENPLIVEDQPWEMAIGWTSIMRDEETGMYRLWYQAYAGGRDARKTHKSVVCYAESRDGVRFTKPELTEHDFQTDREPYAGHYRKTNIVLVGDGGYGDRYANSVVFDPRDPDPSRRYKMLYTDFGSDAQGREWPGFFAAFSADGIRWRKSPDNPLLKTAYGGRGLQPPLRDETPYQERWDERKKFLRKTWPLPFSMSDAADAFFDPNRNTWVVYGKAWIQGPAGGLAWKHAMARVESEDFLNWSAPVLVAAPDDLDAPDTEFHTSPVFYYKGCYFCLNQILRARGERTGGKSDAMYVELMLSRDGFRWERPFRKQPFIASGGQAFSNGGIFTNATPVILDDEIRFYYGGYNGGAIGGGQQLADPSQQSGVGMASLVRDRFAGIRPVARSAQVTLKRPLEHVGQVTLKPLELLGTEQLRLNADARRGEIRVELLDERGYRVRGFTRDDAEPISGDALDHPVRWKTRSLGDLPPGRYSLRLHLERAEVFAVSL